MNVRILDPKPNCTVEGCIRPATSHRALYCQAHYARVRKHGSPDINLRDVKPKDCDFPGCPKPATSSRAPYCATHEMRIRRHGDVGVLLREPRPLEEYWREKITVTEAGCWNWYKLSKEGYGYAGKKWMHRWTWEQFRGPIPNGYEVDHLCRNPACCNPDHLEPVPPAENKRRARSANGQKTHCRQGHEYTPENTYIGRNRRGGMKRSCRACGRAATVAYLARKREAAASE